MNTLENLMLFVKSSEGCALTIGATYMIVVGFLAARYLLK